MSTRWAVTVVLCAMVGCDSTIGTIRLGDAEGWWTFTFQAQQANCGRVVELTEIRLYLVLVPTGQTYDRSTRWYHAGIERPATGTLDDDHGTLDLNLWGSTGAIRLAGRVAAGGSFTGIARDPSPGFGTVFTTGICDYRVTGVHDG